MSGLWFEDFTVGRRFRTPGATLTEAEIISFALTYDPQPIHIDAEAARHSPFGGLIASGFQTVALSFRLFVQTGVLEQCSLGGSGIDDLRWPVPVRPGDTLRAEVEVLYARASASRPDRGKVKLGYRAVNQRGELVMSCSAHHILLKRPKGDGRTVIV